MALDYFIIDETPTQRDYIEANTAGAVSLRWFPTFSSWATPQFISDYENTVRYWRDTDRRNWFDSVVAPITAAILNNLRGYAFEDTYAEYGGLPGYVTKSAAFTKYGWVFVPDNVVDPRSGEIVNPDQDTDFDWGSGDSGDGDDEIIVTEEPSMLSSLAKWAIIIAAGGATWYVAHKAASRYF